MTTKSVKIFLSVIKTFSENWLKMICNWSVYYPKGQLFWPCQISYFQINFSVLVLPDVDLRELGRWDEIPL